MNFDIVLNFGLRILEFNHRLMACNSKGFTLLEVVASIAVITIVFFSMVTVFPFSLKISKRSQNLTTATYLAQAGIETALSSSYDDLIVGDIEARHRLSDDQDNFLYAFERETRVNYVDENLVDSAADTSLKKIESIVYWHNPFMVQEQQYAIATLVSKN